MMNNFIGRQLGNYRLVKLLGEGGFASVYLGQHVQIATQQAAIKVLHLTQVKIQQFRQEAETIAALKHPHIVRLLDFDIEQATGTPFLVLDYAPNGSLRTCHVNGEQLPLETIMQYVTHIADALQYAHDKQNIIHRDIKLDNVLIDQHGTLLLSDFGIAVISKTGRTTRSVAHGTAGTPYYMAPEMFRGKPEKASDQYSLAVKVYRWLCGTLPFSEGNFIQLGYKHSNVPVPPLRDKEPTISADVEAVIMRALSKQPQDRFASVHAFAEALEAASKKPAIGQQLGNYRLVKLLGEGGFASVYLGQHVNIATQQAAIKVLHLAGVDQQKFQREAETIAALRHPHIVRLLDFDFQSGTRHTP